MSLPGPVIFLRESAGVTNTGADSLLAYEKIRSLAARRRARGVIAGIKQLCRMIDCFVLAAALRPFRSGGGGYIYLGRAGGWRALCTPRRASLPLALRFFWRIPYRRRGGIT